jgi:murein DD-endopeptidase MepM/ murein hydrolase activator NlpD
VRSRGTGGCLTFVVALLAITASPANAALPHVVQPGETLWSIAYANNLTTRTVAVFNGLPEDAQVVEGQTIQVPTVDEGAAALASAGVTTTTSSSTDSAAATASTSSPDPAETAASGYTTDPSSLTQIVSAPGMGHVPSPWGELHLLPAAADAWNAMRQEALEVYGIDIYPGGPISAYRTYEQQAALYELFLSGQGEPANPPGTSSHELGTAVDVPSQDMRWVIDQIGWKYGWGKVHGPDEWWHVDYIGG